MAQTSSKMICICIGPLVFFDTFYSPVPVYRSQDEGLLSPMDCLFVYGVYQSEHIIHSHMKSFKISVHVILRLKFNFKKILVKYLPDSIFVKYKMSL